MDDSITFPTGRKRKNDKADTQGYLMRGEGTRILILMSWVEAGYFVTARELDFEVSSVCPGPGVLWSLLQL